MGWSRPSKSRVGSLTATDSQQIRESSPGKQQKPKTRPQELQDLACQSWPPGRIESTSADGIDNTDVHSPLCADSGNEGRTDSQPAGRSPPVNVQAPFRTSSGRVPLARNTQSSGPSANEHTYRSRSPKTSDSRK